MANVVITVLSLTIGFFFILMGTMKLSPIISDDVYRELRKVFIRAAKVFPFATMTGWRPDAHMFRKVVGSIEVVSGCTMALIPGPLKEVANLALLVLMGGAVYTHYALKEGIDKMTPALVFGLLLACRFIVHLQVRARIARETKQQLIQDEKPYDEKKTD